MLKNFSVILSVTAALGLGIVASADAKGHGGGLFALSVFPLNRFAVTVSGLWKAS